MTENGTDSGLKHAAPRLCVVWVVIGLGAVLAVCAAVWYLRGLPCGTPSECVLPDTAETSVATQTTARAAVMRELTPDELTELKRYEQRLREIAGLTSALYRELAAARQSAPDDPAIARQKATAEALLERYEAALGQVEGVPALTAQIAELRTARAATVSTNIALRARAAGLAEPDEETRQQVKEAAARVVELDAAIGAANLRIEELKRAAWRTDAALGELRRQLLEAEHLYEARLVEGTAVGRLRVRETALREEAQTVSKKVAELRARGVVPDEISRKARMEELRAAGRAPIRKRISPANGVEGKDKP